MPSPSHFPAFMCMRFAWNQAPVIVLRFALTIMLAELLSASASCQIDANFRPRQSGITLSSSQKRKAILIDTFPDCDNTRHIPCDPPERGCSTIPRPSHWSHTLIIMDFGIPVGSTPLCLPTEEIYQRYRPCNCLQMHLRFIAPFPNITPPASMQ